MDAPEDGACLGPIPKTYSGDDFYSRSLTAASPLLVTFGQLVGGGVGGHVFGSAWPGSFVKVSNLVFQRFASTEPELRAVG